MQKFYIKVVDNIPKDFPITEDNLKQVLGVDTLIDSILSINGYAKFQITPLPIGTDLISEDGFELCNDGVVRNLITTTPWSQQQKLDRWIRERRNYTLYMSDWTQGTDSPLTIENKTAWVIFRNELRNLPQLYSNIQIPDEVIWPIPPTK